MPDDKEIVDDVNQAGSNNLRNIIVIIAVLGLLLVALLAVRSIRSSDETAQEDTPEVEVTDTPEPTQEIIEPTEELEEITPTEVSNIPGEEESVNISPPAGWSPVKNIAETYTAYLPKSFWFRLNGSNKVIFDNNQIPAEATDGKLVVNQEAGTLDSNVAKAEGLLATGFTTRKVNNGRNTFTIVEGLLKADSSTKTSIALTDNNGTTYSVTYKTTTADYPTYLDTFNTEVGVIVFD